MRAKVVKLHKRAKDLAGFKTGKLTVLEPVSKNRQGCVTWLCSCECGSETVFSSDHLTRKTKPVRSCGCNKNRKGKEHPLWGGCGEISGDWWYNHVLRERKQNIRTKVPVEITIEFVWDLFLKQDRKCSLSGIELRFHSCGSKNSASLDRIDSSKGYVEDNVQWVHKHINFMKRTYSQKYFIDMCKKIANNNEDK